MAQGTAPSAGGGGGSAAPTPAAVATTPPGTPRALPPLTAPSGYYAVELYFDPALENQVLKAWNALARRQLSSRLIDTASRPHLPPPRSPTRSASRPPSALSPPASTRFRSRSPRSPPSHPHSTPGSSSWRPRPPPRCSASTRSSASCCARTRALRCPTGSAPTTGSRGAPSPSTCPAGAWPRPSACSESSSCCPSQGTGWTSRWSRSRRRSGKSCPTRSAAAAALEPTKRCCCLVQCEEHPGWTIIFNKDKSLSNLPGLGN